MESLEKLSKLTTKRLLAYYKKHRKHKMWSMYTENGNVDGRTKHLDEVKKMLDKREHVE